MQQLRKKEIKKFFKETVQKRKQTLYLILENVEYARNVAAIFRTADAAGVRKIFLTSISHKPPFGKDLVKVSRHKENSIPWEYMDTTVEVIKKLKKDGFFIVALEITDTSAPISELPALVAGKEKVAIIAGSEVYGVINKTLAEVDAAVYIPMYGKGASINVAASVAIGLFGL